MSMHSVFRTLIGKRIRVELKNEVVLEAKLHDIDLFLNLKLSNIKIIQNNSRLFIHLDNGKNTFLRGSSVKLIWIKEEDVNLTRMESSVRKEILHKRTTGGVEEEMVELVGG